MLLNYINKGDESGETNYIGKTRRYYSGFIIVTFIILLFKGGNELSELTNMVIALGSIAIAALVGKVVSTKKDENE